MSLDFTCIPTPSYVLDERLLEKNLKILDSVQQRTGCNILLALKGFSMFSTFPLISQYLAGTTASSLFEARLGFEEMKKEVHVYSPSYIPEDFDELLEYCDHMVFNSFDQWEQYKGKVHSYNHFESGNESLHKKHISCGLRINPEYSEIETPLYNPCYTHSRLGITETNFHPDRLDGIEGLHFHTLCEQNSDALAHTIPIVDKKFGSSIKKMKWLNMGGGHHITRDDYDIDLLVQSIEFFQQKYGIPVYLEPGEAVALNTGYLVSSVLDIVYNGMEIAMLDTSAACHMPDVIEMPYRPNIIGAGLPGELAFTYRLGGPTCLAGDIIGDYSFKEPLKQGDRVVFCDMAHYTMVKNNTFNGVNLPTIVKYNNKNGMEIIRRFGYDDYKNRLS